MSKAYDDYYQGKIPHTVQNKMWPLYGKGLESLGKDDKIIVKNLPEYGPDELLIRHDACGLCFSDIKVIRLGQEHPRIYRDMQKEPVVLGHEVSMTVVGVGDNLKNEYSIGDRFIIQADIFVDGVGYAYGYEIQGGLSQYNIIDQRVLNGDGGNYLIPIQPQTGYAESALVEPWACVIAAYYLQYRDHLKPGGTAWFIGPDDGTFSLSTGMDENSHPLKIKLTQMTGAFGNWLREKAKELGITIEEVDEVTSVEGEAEAIIQADDIILLSPTAKRIEQVNPYLAPHGILAFSSNQKLDRKVKLDVGRIHYNRWLFLGGSEEDLAEIYRHAPLQSELKKDGKVMFVGAGGPMGRMHVQHAIESKDHPGLILCSDASEERLRDLEETFAGEAKSRGIHWLCVNPLDTEAYQETMQPFKADGFDDIIMLVPIPGVIADGYQWLADDGVMNVFAGVARGTMAELDLNALRSRNARVIGHSASQIEDMLTMLQKVEQGELNTNLSIAAVGSLSAAKDGMEAMINATYPGKVVIFPNIRELPLTSVPDLVHILPSVAAKLKDGKTWTKEAEQAFLDEMIEGEMDA
jgi:D-arabinose 1-dehydrogenase-like Zn-dependent alcohol dehydrogenase